MPHPESEPAPDDARRFTALYRDHHSLVRDFACRRVGADLAQEIVSDTFLVAWRRLHDVPENPIPWLYRVALFEIANLRRRRARASQLHDVLVENRSRSGPAHPADELSDLVRAVGAAFAALSPPEQEILRLAAWEQLSAAEGAAVLRCSVPAYRMRLHRARIRLANASGARELLRPGSAHRSPAAAVPPLLGICPQPIGGTGLVL
jgi:RNA polymerase sigma-70 factor (ECF subfamily)